MRIQNWLELGTVDLARGLGGVEVHSRSLARELKGLGLHVEFSQDILVLRHSNWDVVHTHGSQIDSEYCKLISRWRSKKAGRVWVHTLHGTTLGRMAACREWTWVGGYLAAARETLAVMNADVILAVSPGFHLSELANRLGKKVVICGSGWDASSSTESMDLSDELMRCFSSDRPVWLFVGRGEDPVKGASRLKEAMVKTGHPIQWITVPGDGFEECNDMIRSGVLHSAQVQSLLRKAQGLVVSSEYEGYCLAGVEALSEGVCVVTTPVGVFPSLRSRAKGLWVSESFDSEELAQGIRNFSSQPFSESERMDRALANRKLLQTWKEVAEKSLQAVTER